MKSGNAYPHKLSEKKTNSLDGTVLDAVKLALVQVLGRKIFDLKFGLDNLTVRELKVKYWMIDPDKMEARVKYLDFRFVVEITGLSRRMSYTERVTVLKQDPWILEDKMIELRPKCHAPLLDFVDSWSNDLLTLVLKYHMSYKQALIVKQQMCPIPMFEIEDYGSEGDQDITARYMFTAETNTEVAIKYLVSNQGFATAAMAFVTINGQVFETSLKDFC